MTYGPGRTSAQSIQRHTSMTDRIYMSRGLRKTGRMSGCTSTQSSRVHTSTSDWMYMSHALSHTEECITGRRTSAQSSWDHRHKSGLRGVCLDEHTQCTPGRSHSLTPNTAGMIRSWPRQVKSDWSHTRCSSSLRLWARGQQHIECM
jgi:hypothetical protein